jgi:hypothetical protein
LSVVLSALSSTAVVEPRILFSLYLVGRGMGTTILSTWIKLFLNWKGYAKTQEMEGDGSGKYLVPNLGKRSI